MIIRLSKVHEREFVDTCRPRKNEWILTKLRIIRLFLWSKVNCISCCCLPLTIGIDYFQIMMLSFVTHYMLRNFTYSSRILQEP